MAANIEQENINRKNMLESLMCKGDLIFDLCRMVCLLSEPGLIVNFNDNNIVDNVARTNLVQHEMSLKGRGVYNVKWVFCRSADLLASDWYMSWSFKPVSIIRDISIAGEQRLDD